MAPPNYPQSLENFPTMSVQELVLKQQPQHQQLAEDDDPPGRDTATNINSSNVNNATMQNFSPFDGLCTPVCTVDVCGVITDWNAAMTELTGYSRFERMHRYFREIIFAPPPAPPNNHQFSSNNYHDLTDSKNWWDDLLNDCVHSGSRRQRKGVLIPSLQLIGQNGTIIPVRMKLSATSTTQTSPYSPVSGVVCFVEELDDPEEVQQDQETQRPEDRTVRANTNNHSAHEQQGAISALKSSGDSTTVQSASSKNGEESFSLCHHYSLSLDPLSVAVPIFVLDSAARVCLWNQAMVDLTGYRLIDFVQNETLLLDTFLWCCEQESNRNDSFLTAIARSLARKGETNLIAEWRAKDGRHLHVTMSTSMQVLPATSSSRSPNFGLSKNDQAQEYRGVAILVQDRTAQFLAEQDRKRLGEGELTAINHKQQQLAKAIPAPDPSGQSVVVEQANLPIVAVDCQGVIDLWNPHAEKLFGWSAQDVLRRHKFWDLCTLGSINNGSACKKLEVEELGMSIATSATLSPEESTSSSTTTTTTTTASTLTLPEPNAASQSVRKALEAACVSGTETSQFELEFQIKSGDVLYLLANVFPRRAHGLGAHLDGLNSDAIITGALIVAQDVTESAQHDRAVAALARELQQLIDTANSLIFGVDCAGHVNEWNDKTAEITGFTADEAFNMPYVTTFVAPENQEAAKNVIERAVNGRGTTNFELEILTKSGEVRYLLVNATTRRNVENEVVGAVVIAQDVTEAAKHDRAIAAMASELRQLIDTANAPIFGIDCDGDVNEWNDKAAEITGYTKEEAFDCSLVETFIVPNMQNSVRIVLENALQGRGTSNYELAFRTKSSEIRYLLVNATTRRDAENNVVGVVVVAQNVTEAVQRDKAVAGMALELRQLIDTANAPIFGIDIDGNVNEWNRRTQEITGYSKEETFDEPLVDRFIAPSMRSKVQEILDNALQGNETSNYELEFVSKSGEPRFMLVNATTRRDPEFNVVGVVGVAQDVTDDRKHAQELRKMQYLQATQEAKVETERNMTAYFAHELRNPLGAIDSALSAMPDNLPESAQSLVSGMQLCSSFMSSIMNNLLDVRKMEEGKMTLNVVPISLPNLLDRVHKMLLPSVKPGVAFSNEICTNGKDWVLGDEHRIQQVLTNVITNAIKYTVSGTVKTRISWDGKLVRFECVDTGPGIPKNEQEKLFHRFVQRGGAPGTGLGLAIAKHLVDLAGGTIRFDSDPTIKAGTTCIVEMPLALCECPETKEETDTSVLEEPIAFLIIDDIKMNRMMLKRRIKKGIAPNCDIREACTGEEALEICGKETFDVIIVDQYMEEAGGVMVGTDVVYAMRRMRIDSIIIGCSGNDLEDEFREAGADWVWQKPMPSNADIISHLRAALVKRSK